MKSIGNPFLTFIISSVASVAVAHEVSVTVTDGTGIDAAVVSALPLEGASASPSVMSLTDAEGRCTFDCADGRWAVSVKALGYDALADTISVNGSPITLHYTLSRGGATQLGEVTVSGDSQGRITRMADGLRFYLSSHAKEQGNPFLALEEIPVLKVNLDDQTVSTMDGKKLLVLINGRRVNSGIAPINAADIVSVDYIDNPSARWLQEGYECVVDIKVRRDRSPYQWLEVSTRNDVPLNNGFGALNYEIGQTNFSVYANAYYEYTLDTDITTDTHRYTNDYTQRVAGSSSSSNNKPGARLMATWLPSKKDYLALMGSAFTKHTRSTLDEDGTLTPTGLATEGYEAHSHSRDVANSAHASLYYSHLFTSENELEALVSYDHSSSWMRDARTDLFGDETDVYDSYFDTRANRVKATLDWSMRLPHNMGLIAGNHFSWLHANVGNERVANANAFIQPRFIHENANEYFYGGLNGHIGKYFLYSASAGMESIIMTSAGERNTYTRPRLAGSLTARMRGGNSLRLSYGLTNTAPSLTQLNPYNTSTDPLVENVGSPMLKPQTRHRLSLDHSFNRNGWYLGAGAWWTHYSDCIEPWGYTRPGGVWRNTWRNFGHANFPAIYLQGGWWNDSFNVNAYVAEGGSSFDGSAVKWKTYLNLYASYRWEKFRFYLTYTHDFREIIPVSVTWCRQPQEAGFQVNYFFTPDFWIGFKLQHFTGEYNTRSVTVGDGWRSENWAHHKDEFLRPFFIIRYTMRRNTDRRLERQKDINVDETPIMIER